MKYLKQAIIRGIIPLVTMTVVAYSMYQQGFDSYQVKSTFLAGLIVTVVAAFSVIYEFKHWSLKKQSAIHFLAMLVTVFPCLVVSEWYPVQAPLDYLKLFAVFVATGIVLWAIAYAISRFVEKKRQSTSPRRYE